MRTIVVDSGLCNLGSVVRAIEECGGRPEVATRATQLEAASRLVLPGVGTFSDGMRALHEIGFVSAIRGAASRGVPILGICLGMQLLADSGEEGGVTEGLGLVPGDVRRLRPAASDERVPHVGWNEVRPTRGSGIFEEVPSGTDFYFVHSYAFHPREERVVLARTPYCGGFASAVGSGRVFGVQFHPEKSSVAGFRVLRNFLALAAC